ncbi:MAG: hypothetical protein ACUVYA_03205, partial [Planctomycetota bacterium]
KWSGSDVMEWSRSVVHLGVFRELLAGFLVASLSFLVAMQPNAREAREVVAVLLAGAYFGGCSVYVASRDATFSLVRKIAGCLSLALGYGLAAVMAQCWISAYISEDLPSSVLDYATFSAALFVGQAIVVAAKAVLARTVVLALAALLVAAAVAGAGSKIVSLRLWHVFAGAPGDLCVEAARVEHDGTLVYRVKNLGPDELPVNAYRTEEYIDGTFWGGQFADSWRGLGPGESVEHRLAFPLAPRLRHAGIYEFRVTVIPGPGVVDPNRENNTALVRWNAAQGVPERSGAPKAPERRRGLVW